LSDEDLVQLMTQNTANILGISSTHGSIDKGKKASFSVFDKAIFEDDAKIQHNITNGIIHELNGE